MGETLEELQAELRKQKAIAEHKREMARIQAEREKLKLEIAMLKQQNSGTVSALDALKSAGSKVWDGTKKLAADFQERERQEKAAAKKGPRKQKPVKKGQAHIPGFQETWSLFD